MKGVGRFHRLCRICEGATNGRLLCAVVVGVWRVWCVWVLLFPQAYAGHTPSTLDSDKHSWRAEGNFGLMED
jgi:hypothetical protein